MILDSHAEIVGKILIREPLQHFAVNLVEPKGIFVLTKFHLVEPLANLFYAGDEAIILVAKFISDAPGFSFNARFLDLIAGGFSHVTELVSIRTSFLGFGVCFTATHIRLFRCPRVDRLGTRISPRRLITEQDEAEWYIGRKREGSRQSRHVNLPVCRV